VWLRTPATAFDERQNQKNLGVDKFRLVHGAENCSTASGFTPGWIFGISAAYLQSREQSSKARGSKELRALILPVAAVVQI
jgi:hypothetical protein